MKILISGGLGFVGSHLINRLSRGNEIALIVRDSSRENINSELNLVIGFNQNLQQNIISFDPDIFIHLAAKYIRKHSFDTIDLILESNIQLGIKIIESLRHTKCRKIINVGSTLQFYNSENRIANNLYAASKNAFEEFLKYYVNELDLKVLTLYLSDTYGENDKRGKLVDYIMESIISNNKLKLTKSEQKISLTHVEDLIDGFEIAIKTLEKMKDRYKSYFLCNPQLYSITELVELTIEISGRNYRADFGYHQYSHNEVFKPVIGKLLPGWYPKIDISSGLTRHFKYKQRSIKSLQ
jgi:nucleoside-diphosphate-sugar epimerase